MTSLLLVHGAWHGAWCWEDHLVRWLTERGHRAVAIDLQHHGAQDRDGLGRARIRDYVADVGAAAASLPAPLVVVGHSMGGFVLQHWLAENRPAGAVLVAPVPSRGALAASLRVGRRHPVTFARVNATMDMQPLVATTALVRELFFTPSTPDDVVRRCHERVGGESYIGYLDMVAFALPRPKRVTTPMLVVGAREDGIFTPAEIETTARAYGTEPVMLPGGHDVMLDVAWESLAERLDAWVRTLR